MAYSQNFPAQRPSFMFDASNAGRIPPNMTYTRASTANVFDGAKHLSSENVVPYSSDISTKTLEGVTATGSQTAPDGGTDAYKLTENSTTGFHRFYEHIKTEGTAITFSAYFKYIGRQWVRVRLTDSGASDRFVWFDIQNGVAGTAETGFSNVSISSSGNGYYKVSATLATSVTSGGTHYLVVEATSGDGASGASIAGLNADAFAVWGLQVSHTGETVLNETSGQIHREYAPTLVSKANNAARFETATDGQSAAKGLLVEGQSTNLALHSEQFGSGSYHAFRLHVDASSAIAPDGTLTANTLRENDAASNTHGLYQDIAVSGTTAHTVSFYAKAAGRNHLAVRFDATNGVFGNDWVYFNLSTGAVGAKDADITASIESCGNGWYRCIATRTALAAATGRVVIYLADADNSSAYTGNSYSGVLAWGFSFEANSFASSYTKTEAATVTRAADSLSMTDASLFNTGTGGLVVEAVVKSLNDGVAAWLGTDGNNYHQVGQFGSTTYPLISKADGVASAVLSSSAVSTGAAHKVAASWGTNDFAGCVDGGTVVTDTSGTLPAVNKLTVGNYNAAAAWLDGHVKRVAIYSEALSDTNLQALTS